MGPQSKDRGKTSPAIMCIKVLLHIFNLIYLIIGVCVLAIGIWTQVELKNYMQLTQLYYANAAYIMIGVGILIMLVAVGGFFCTAKDKIALLYLYGIFITLLAIMQIAAGIAGGVMAKTLDKEIVDGLYASLKKSSSNMQYWNKVQLQLKCCGVNNSSDWTAHNLPIPDSCYSDGSHHSTKAPAPAPTPTTTTATTIPGGNATTTEVELETTTGNANVNETSPTSPPSRGRRETSDGVLNGQGCYKEIKDNINKYLGVIVGVCVGFVILQVIGATLACCLARKTSRNNYEQIY